MKLRTLLLACAVAVSPMAMMGCGESGGVKSANITPGNMPDGESWTGVYFHPVFGNLHMVEQDTNVIAKWMRTDKSAWGRLSGTKNGNVLHFQWSETKYGMVGPSATSTGRGYFVYKMGKEGGIAELDGQYGLGQDEAGSDWHCVKQQRVLPDLNSITGDLPGGGGSQGGGFE